MLQVVDRFGGRQAWPPLLRDWTIAGGSAALLGSFFTAGQLMELASSWQRGARRALRFLWAGTGILSISVLVGWATNQGWLKSIMPGLSEMKINTALCLAMAAAALWSRATENPSAWRIRAGIAAGIAVAMVGAATAFQYATGLDLGIDDLLGRDHLAAATTQHPGRMGANTAVSLLLLGIGLALSHGPSRAARLAAQYALAACLFLPVAALIGYLYTATQLLGLRSSTQMALHTALSLCALAVGGLLADIAVGPMNYLLRRTPGGALMRWAMTIFFFAIPAVGWLHLQAEHAGVFDSELGLATFAMFNVVFVLAVTGLLADRIDRQVSALARANLRLLDAADERFRNIVESSVQGVLVSREWHAVFANAEALRIAGCGNFEEMRDGPPLIEYIGAEFRDRMTVVRDDLVLKGVPVPSHEIRVVGRDGVERWALVILRRIEWYGGPATLTLLVETTERREVEERLRQAQKMDAIGRLTGGLAHEFNNLLAVIMGSAEELSDTLASNPEALKTLGQILKAADSGAKLTGSMLAFSRRKPLRLEQVDPVLVLRDVEHMARATLPETIRLTVFTQDDVRLVSSDAAMLQSAILNLIINARDACAGTGTIMVRARNKRIGGSADNGVDLPPGEYVEISVTDDGAGMTEAVKARIFEPFFSTKEAGKGTGLGLPMVLGFVQQMGGTMSVASEAGEGTTMTMYLPAAGAAAAAPADSAPSCSDVETAGRQRILVVEDNPDVLMATAAMVRKLGYTAITAIDGPSAITAFERVEGVDLLLTDVVMPNGMSGLDTARALQLRQPGLPVVYMSGYNENVVVHHGVVDQGVILLNKPFTRAELATALAAALRAAARKSVVGEGQ